MNRRYCFVVTEFDRLEKQLRGWRIASKKATESTADIRGWPFRVKTSDFDGEAFELKRYIGIGANCRIWRMFCSRILPDLRMR